MTLCEKCIHGDICVIQCGYDEGDERALTYCSEFKSKDDVVEVVRCKDCKWWTPMDTEFGWHNEGRTDGECQMLYSNHYAERALTEREHFCSYGERKDN